MMTAFLIYVSFMCRLKIVHIWSRKDGEESIDRYVGMEALRPDFAVHMGALNHLISMNENDCLQWATNQAYIGVTACAGLRLGSCPMSGFLPAEVHKVLSLSTNEWPVVYLAIGSEADENLSFVCIVVDRANFLFSFTFPIFL